MGLIYKLPHQFAYALGYCLLSAHSQKTSYSIFYRRAVYFYSLLRYSSKKYTTQYLLPKGEIEKVNIRIIVLLKVFFLLAVSVHSSESEEFDSEDTEEEIPFEKWKENINFGFFP